MKKASEIYAEQNRVIHAVLRKLGFNYRDDRDLVLYNVEIAVGRRAGLSQLSLGERQLLLKHMAREWGVEIACPAVPALYRNWKKGQPEPGQPRGAFKKFTGRRARQKKYALWLWCSLGYAPEKIDERVRRQFGIDRLEWLNDQHDLHALITDLLSRCRKAGIRLPAREGGGK